MGMDSYAWALAAGMLITGSINTLSTKAADFEVSINRYGDKAVFNHPFVQALGMFLGEFTCLLAYTYFSMRARSLNDDSFKRAKPHSKLIFLLPAMCDMTATSVMYLGLALTSSSVFQMLRGSVVIFTAAFSVIFLKRRIKAYQWVGVALVLAGTIVVGLQSYVCSSGDSSSSGQGKAMLGNILIIIAQIIVATQMVVEEKFIGGYDIPALQVVGWEGVWGGLVLSALLGVMYVVPTTGTFLCTPNVNANNDPFPNIADNACNHLEDVYDAFVQMGNNKMIILYTLLNLLSIACFNFFGVSVTKAVNASTRMVLDSLRTMVIWGFSLGVGWEKFCWVQIIGFVVLLGGTFVYNGVVHIPGFDYEELPQEDDAELLELEAAGGEYEELDSSSLNQSVETFKIKGFKGSV